jgi:hypothetical protein
MASMQGVSGKSKAGRVEPTTIARGASKQTLPHARAIDGAPGLMITTEATVAEAAKKDATASGHGGHDHRGGMCGMDF